MLSRGKQWLIVLVIAVICLAPYGMQWLGKTGPFLGTDEKAEMLVASVSPDYHPWINSIWKPPSEEVESLLFALQASLGLAVIVYYLVSNQKKKRDEA